MTSIPAATMTPMPTVQTSSNAQHAQIQFLDTSNVDAESQISWFVSIGEGDEVVQSILEELALRRHTHPGFFKTNRLVVAKSHGMDDEDLEVMYTQDV